MKKKLFIDGQSGTTGLKIREILNDVKDIEIVTIPEDKKKDLNVKKEYLNGVDVVMLCLPDDASKESVSLITNKNVKIIDTSTAHRVDPNWVYGFPEKSKDQREKIKNSSFIANPGCHATGFISLVYPLIAGKILDQNHNLFATSITGYSGGGKALIEKYEGNTREKETMGTRPYSLELSHKHLKEMSKESGINNYPIFTPIVGDFYKGMLVSVPIFLQDLKKRLTVSEISNFYKEYYFGEKFINVIGENYKEDLDGIFLDPMKCNDTNRLDIFVSGNDNQILLSARLDNLGKGASGAAIQNLNILMDANEDRFLKA